MKKLFCLFAILFLTTNNAFAISVRGLQTKEKSTEKQVKIHCANLENLSDKDKIKCLFEVVGHLQAQINLNYIYYQNTLAIAGIQCYNGDLTNCY